MKKRGFLGMIKIVLDLTTYHHPVYQGEEPIQHHKRALTPYVRSCQDGINTRGVLLASQATRYSLVFPL